MRSAAGPVSRCAARTRSPGAQCGTGLVWTAEAEAAGAIAAAKLGADDDELKPGKRTVVVRSCIMNWRCARRIGMAKISRKIGINMPWSSSA